MNKVKNTSYDTIARPVRENWELEGIIPYEDFFKMNFPESTHCDNSEIEHLMLNTCEFLGVDLSNFGDALGVSDKLKTKTLDEIVDNELKKGHIILGFRDIVRWIYCYVIVYKDIHFGKSVDDIIDGHPMLPVFALSTMIRLIKLEQDLKCYHPLDKMIVDMNSWYGWADDSSNRRISEIENMRKLLDIMERHLCNKLTPQNIADLRENMQDWEKNIEKLSSMLNNLSPVDLKKEVPLKEDFVVPEEDNIFGDNENYEVDIKADLREELTGEIKEQVSSFVENMMEYVNDFIEKINSYESDEVSYKDLRILSYHPNASDYESDSYEYSSKAKAKVACKEQVQSLVDDIMENFEDEKEQITSSAADYYGGLEEAFAKFVNEFSESYDEYMSLECEGSAAEYVSSRKPILFGKDILCEKVKENDLKLGFAALVKERFDNQIKKHVDVKKYFSLCKYDENDGVYCYIMDDACDAIFVDVKNVLMVEIRSFPEKVFEFYSSMMSSYCEMLKNRLAEL